MSIWVCGEVLIDLLPDEAVVGGGPANTARALARLGLDVEFIAGISSDMYGEQARRTLIRDGVGLRHALSSEKPTATASITLSRNGSASYVFSTDETATFDFNRSWLPDPSRFDPSLLHIGTLATIIEPGVSALLNWARVVSEFAPIIYDPNIRPDVLKDKEKYALEVEKWIEISSIVKVSDEDLAWLYPDESAVDVARRWISDGVILAVITRGSSGISGVTADEIIDVPSAKVEIIDTVGAGDTVGAILVEAVKEFGPLNIKGEVLREILNCAAVAAGITCSRAGAQPPARYELMLALEKSGRNAIY